MLRKAILRLEKACIYQTRKYNIIKQDFPVMEAVLTHPDLEAIQNSEQYAQLIRQMALEYGSSIEEMEYYIQGYIEGRHSGSIGPTSDSQGYDYTRYQAGWEKHGREHDWNTCETPGEK